MSNTSYKIIRYTFALLFVWFGLKQLVNPVDWVGFLPKWTGYFPIPGVMLVQLNGWLEIIAAVFLLGGVFIRVIAILLSLHILMIAWSAGGAIGVRDAALALMGLALVFSPVDNWSIDYLNKKQDTINK